MARILIDLSEVSERLLLEDAPDYLSHVGLSLLESLGLELVVSRTISRLEKGSRIGESI